MADTTHNVHRLKLPFAKLKGTSTVIKKPIKFSLGALVLTVSVGCATDYLSGVDPPKAEPGLGYVDFYLPNGECPFHSWTISVEGGEANRGGSDFVSTSKKFASFVRIARPPGIHRFYLRALSKGEESTTLSVAVQVGMQVPVRLTCDYSGSSISFEDTRSTSSIAGTLVTRRTITSTRLYPIQNLGYSAGIATPFTPKTETRYHAPDCRLATPSMSQLPSSFAAHILLAPVGEQSPSVLSRAKELKAYLEMHPRAKVEIAGPFGSARFGHYSSNPDQFFLKDSFSDARWSARQGIIIYGKRDLLDAAIMIGTAISTSQNCFSLYFQKSLSYDFVILFH